MTVSSVDQTSINSTSQSIRQFFNLQTTHQTQPPQIITSNNSDQELTLVQKPQTPQEQSPLLSTSYQPRSTQNPSCLSPTSHHPSHSPDLRRHSSTPHLSLSAAPQTVIDSDQSKYQAAQPTSSDHQFLDVDHNPNHRHSPSIPPPRPHSSASAYHSSGHHTPMFHLSSTHFPPDHSTSGNSFHTTHGPAPIASTAALAIAAAASSGVPLGINRAPSMAPSMTSRIAPTRFKDVAILYQVVAERRTAFDNLLWQVPATSLTAHAFLFSISLAADTGRFARIASMSLCIVITVLTLHLFTRQLQAEDADHRWLTDFEERHQIDYFDRAHGARWKDYRAQRPPGAGRLGWLAMHRSYPLWSKGMIAIGALAFAILILAIFHEPTLVGYNCQL